MSLLWSFSIFDCKALNVYVADGQWRHKRWVDLPHGVTLQISGKACPQAVPSQATRARCKMLSSETADSSAAHCYCRCKEWRNASIDFSDLYLNDKKVSPRASSAWLKKSSKRSSSNWYLIRDQFGSFIPASNRQVSSEQCSGHSLGILYCSRSMRASYSAPSATSALTWSSFFSYYIVKVNGKLNKKAKVTQRHEEIHTKGSLALTSQMVEQFDFLLFLKS